MSARETALDVLIACRKQDAWVNGALKEYADRDRLDRRDAALAARLCYGVVQNRLLLDFYLQQLLTGKLKDLHPAVRDILHLGLYQILMMDRIPDSAAVNESVTLAKKYCRKLRYAPGLVNAVLRNAIRSKDTLKQPIKRSIRYSHPEKLLKLLEETVGSERMEPMLNANNGIPSTVVQVNTLKTTAEELQKELEEQGVKAQPHSWMPDCLTLSETGNLECLPSFREGKFYVQDAAAKLPALCAKLPEGQNLRVLDCCAAPGGKSFAAAIIMGDSGTVFSGDIHSHKLGLIENGAERLGIHCIKTMLQDASRPVPEWNDSMDAVIADVPCSGYGIIRKKPDIRYKDPDSMKDLPELQLAILRQQARYVKPGGVLIYSTCTLLKRENQEVVQAFLKENTAFHPETLPLPAPLKEDETGMITLVPGQYDTDGFFVCRMRRDL